ncbi:MAG: NAD-dependent epimerase/dehydratase family protein [Pilosibacter sp.]
MNIIMTGSTSFVGAATVRELLRRGHTVTAIARPASSKLGTILDGNEEALLSGRLLVTENDLSEPEKLLEKVTKPQDVFCHFGWGGSGSASRTDQALQEKIWRSPWRRSGRRRPWAVKVPVLRLPGRIRNAPGSDHGGHGLRAEIPATAKRSSRCAKRAKRSAVSSGLRYIHAQDFQRLRPRRPPVDVRRVLPGRIPEQQGDVPRRACTQNWNFLYIDDLARGMAALCEAEEATFEGISKSCL